MIEIINQITIVSRSLFCSVIFKSPFGGVYEKTFVIYNFNGIFGFVNGAVCSFCR